MEMLARSVAAFRVATRLASASIIRCCAACLIEVRSNFRLPRHCSMRRAPAMPHSAGSLPPDKRHSRLTTVRRGCDLSRIAEIHGEAMYTAPTLRSACSSSSCNLAMCGVEGEGPSSFLSGVAKGDTLFREREYPPFYALLRGAGNPPAPARNNLQMVLLNRFQNLARDINTAR